MSERQSTGTKPTVESCIAWACVGYVLPIVITTVLWCERLGYPYTRAGLSGGKWRGEYGQLNNFVGMWSLWVYPLTLLATLFFLYIFVDEKQGLRKWLAFVTACVMAFCFVLFWKMSINPIAGD